MPGFLSCSVADLIETDLTKRFRFDIDGAINKGKVSGLRGLAAIFSHATGGSASFPVHSFPSVLF